MKKKVGSWFSDPKDEPLALTEKNQPGKDEGSKAGGVFQLATLVQKVENYCEEWIWKRESLVLVGSGVFEWSDMEVDECAAGAESKSFLQRRPPSQNESKEAPTMTFTTKMPASKWSWWRGKEGIFDFNFLFKLSTCSWGPFPNGNWKQFFLSFLAQRLEGWNPYPVKARQIRRKLLLLLQTRFECSSAATSRLCRDGCKWHRLMQSSAQQEMHCTTARSAIEGLFWTAFESPAVVMDALDRILLCRRRRCLILRSSHKAGSTWQLEQSGLSMFVLT